MHLGSGVQYRIVGEGGPGAVPVEPTLEDGYIRLMQERRGAQARAA
jgi:hypothetical protein